MNRKWVPLVIASGVLVPFFALVILAYVFTNGSSLPSGAGAGQESPEVGAERDAGKAEAVAVVVPTSVATSSPPLPAPLPKGEGIPLQAVRKEATRCLADASPLHAITVEVHFTPTRDGGFTHVTSNAQDPMLAACIEDVFDELTFDPRRTTDFVPTTHTFRFEPGSP